MSWRLRPGPAGICCLQREGVQTNIQRELSAVLGVQGGGPLGHECLPVAPATAALGLVVHVGFELFPAAPPPVYLGLSWALLSPKAAALPGSRRLSRLYLLCATTLWFLTHVSRSSCPCQIPQWLTGSHSTFPAPLQASWPCDPCLVNGWKGHTSWRLLGKGLLPRENTRASQG